MTGIRPRKPFAVWGLIADLILLGVGGLYGGVLFVLDPSGAAAGTGDGLTWPAIDPYERIDWIWHTPDLRPLQAQVLGSTASDHLPLLAEFEASP